LTDILYFVCKGYTHLPDCGVSQPRSSSWDDPSFNLSLVIGAHFFFDPFMYPFSSK